MFIFAVNLVLTADFLVDCSLWFYYIHTLLCIR